MKVYGPYLRKDGRKHVILYDGKTKKTVSYPKWLMQNLLGRELDSNLETVDHKDEDFTNDSYDNLQLLTRRENIQKSHKPAETITFICPICKTTVTKFARVIRDNLRQGKAGPFCSRSCAGKYRK